MFSVLLCLTLISVQAHQSPLQSDADFQESLMPQELNPVFVPGQDEPLKAVIPLARARRSYDTALTHTPVSYQVKQYSRMISCIVLVLSAIIEIVLFFVELYNM